MSYSEYLIVLCVVALLGFGGFKHFGQTVSGQVGAATSDIGRIGLARGPAAGPGASTGQASDGARTSGSGGNVGSVSAALEATGTTLSPSSGEATSGEATGGFLSGVGSQAVSAVGSRASAMGHAVVHPVQALERFGTAVGNAVAHPGDTWVATRKVARDTLQNGVEAVQSCSGAAGSRCGAAVASLGVGAGSAVIPGPSFL